MASSGRNFSRNVILVEIAFSHGTDRPTVHSSGIFDTIFRNNPNLNTILGV